MTDRHDAGMSPVPQTEEAFALLSQTGTTEIEESLTRIGTQVRDVAPACVGVSLAIGGGDLTFTLVVDQPDSALLEAIKYVDGGPCIQAELDECVRSTLSVPVVHHGDVVGGVNLYASTTDAFAGHHEEIARICGGWAADAIPNADMGFSTKVRAAATPERLHDQRHVDVAVGIVAETVGVDVVTGEERLRSAARRAGVSPTEFARFILDAHGNDLARQPDDEGSPDRHL